LALAGARKDIDNETFRDFRRRLFHGSLSTILQSVEPFMKEWDIVQCSDHHFRRAIYGLGPYIADYPEQTAASGVVYGWCATYVPFKFDTTIYLVCRCDADPADLDNPNASLRTREKTAALLEADDPETLWYNYGIVPDLVVCAILLTF
jgi:hypothetical protein